MTPPAITEAELREQFNRSGLEAEGIRFEVAVQSDAIRITLINAIQARRRLAARQAMTAAIQFQTPKEAA